MISYSLVIVDHPPFDEWVIKKVNYYDVDLLTGPYQSSLLWRQLHPPSGGCPTGHEQSLQHQGVCYWHIATLPRTACFGRDAILRKQELRLCWAVIAPYIWVSPRQATSQSCLTNIQLTQVWTLKVLFLLVPTWRSVNIKWCAPKWTLKDRDKGFTLSQ